MYKEKLVKSDVCDTTSYNALNSNNTHKMQYSLKYR